VRLWEVAWRGALAEEWIVSNLKETEEQESVS
jgi:hypothetical protein